MSEFADKDFQEDEKKEMTLKWSKMVSYLYCPKENKLYEINQSMMQCNHIFREDDVCLICKDKLERITIHRK